MLEYFTVQKIAEVTGGDYYGPDTGRSATVFGAVRDNREVKPGNLFVCIKGERTDGHLYVNSAFESGAACCLTEQTIPDAAGPYVLVSSSLAAIKTLGAYYRRLFDIPVIGITGSVGKTTTKEMIAAVLGAKYHVLKTPANLNNELGVPLTLMSLDEHHQAAVIEMGISEFGEMSRLAEMVRPDIFVITKIGYSHTSSLGGLDGVLRAKSEALVYMNHDGTAIFNGDDDLLWKYDPGIRKITFGLNRRNDIRAENISANGTDSISCDIVSDAKHSTVTIPSYGSHLPLAALPAVCVGQILGMDSSDIARGLMTYKPVDGRAVVTSTLVGPSKKITLIDDCYNANPHSMEAALKSLSGLNGRRLAILGDMLNLGETSRHLHRAVGAFAAQCGIDYLICCGEAARYIYEGFINDTGFDARTGEGTSIPYNTHTGDSNDNTACVRYGKALYFESKESLVAALDGLINDGDALLIKASHSMGFNEIVDYLCKPL